MTTASSPIRLLCVDDHRLVRKGVARLIDLEPDMKVVAEASNGAEAVTQFKRHAPDVTLMDLELPRMDGIQAIAAIRKERPDARIIVLTMYHGDEDIHRALQAGAAAYLLNLRPAGAQMRAANEYALERWIAARGTQQSQQLDEVMAAAPAAKD